MREIVLVHRYNLERGVGLLVFFQNFLYISMFIVIHHEVQLGAVPFEKRFSCSPVAEMRTDYNRATSCLDGIFQQVEILELIVVSV